VDAKTWIALAALCVAVFTLIWQIATEVSQRRTKAHEFHRSGPILRIETVIKVELGVRTFNFNVVNQGRMAVTVNQAGTAVFVGNERVPGSLRNIETNGIIPVRLETSSNVWLQVEEEHLRGVQAAFPGGRIVPFAVGAGLEPTYGPPIFF
jgi:hypothetical protein